MPVIANAAKALRQDQKRTLVNRPIRQRLLTTIKKVVKTKDKALLPELYSVVDTAAKHKIIKKNKAARIKSRLTKRVAAPAA